MKTSYKSQLEDTVMHLRDELHRLRLIIRAPFSEAELKLVDKNCDWIAFKHSWNAIMKSRGGLD